ncbi:lysophospholipase-like protein 1 [Lingula anatina]|uniref:palmitoyl-protein hydrolase n=1 Tax=Lingula anatina TaxID=7574 RepID=A0A1S3K9W1_LINAN|nr:lysophospholipase-like protein 1 [Lingula anatina]|eukprot:XP_013419287.1 lysophospholipase-like protein 1 [Lingula anatina]
MWIMCASRILPPKIAPLVVSQTKPKHTGTLFFFHGSGDTSDGIKLWLKEVTGKEFVFPHMKIIYPSAPVRPYTPMLGQLSTVWFDRKQISPFVPEDTKTLEESCSELNKLIETEVENGIPLERIILGGFSMGGAMALHLGYRYQKQVAGVIALSSFLNQQSVVYEGLKHDFGPLPPLFQAAGTADSLVLFDWVATTNKELSALGVQTTFHKFDNLCHELSREEVQLMRKWIEERVPDDR